MDSGKNARRCRLVHSSQSLGLRDHMEAIDYLPVFGRKDNCIIDLLTVLGVTEALHMSLRSRISSCIAGSDEPIFGAVQASQGAHRDGQIPRSGLTMTERCRGA
jgi:hypothetical protein